MPARSASYSVRVTTAAQLIASALSEVGYVESPAGSNCNKFAPEAHLKNCTYWCGAYTSAILIRNRVLCPPNTLTLSTRVNMRGWQDADQWVLPDDIVEGDVVFEHVSNRNGPDHNVPSHTEFATGAWVHDHLPTVGGNTSPDDHGVQDNGGGVYAKLRAASVVIGAGRPKYATLPDEGDFDMPFLYKVHGTDTTCLFDRGAIDPDANALNELTRVLGPPKEVNAAFHNWAVEVSEGQHVPGPIQ